jgi:hypothetical protein
VLGPINVTQGLLFRVHGANYWAIAWMDSKSSGADRNALRSIIASIRAK